jgi:hypothetical protein
MESGVFERVQEYLTLIGRMELLTCSATQTSFTRIRDQANKVSFFQQSIIAKKSNFINLGPSMTLFMVTVAFKPHSASSSRLL